MIRPALSLTARITMATMLAGTMLTGCATAGGGARADVAAARAETALAKGNHSSAVKNAEAAVAGDPRNAAYRAMLGSAYLNAGRFSSAATSFDDAMDLGDNSPRTALSLALALMGQGKMRESAALLNDWEQDIATADLGLALALAGQPERGIHLMSNAIRGGDNTPKMRQNLAYAYALSGRWREARLMAQQDIPADEVGHRIQEWAEMARPEAWQLRIATMLDVPAGVADAGQPATLALANSPAMEQLVAEASSAAPESAPAAPQLAELPPLSPPAAMAAAAPIAPSGPTVAIDSYAAPSAGRPTDFQTAFATTGPSGGSLAAVTQDAVRFATTPAVAATPARHGVQPAAAKPAPRADGSHMVQLGSFGSEQGARRAWGIYVKNHPELAGHQMVITKAMVKGKTYWRVAAAGFGRGDATSMCGKVKARGAGCFAYASSRALPGAVNTGVQLARR